MEPTVAAAWIAAGSGVFGAVVGVTGAVLGAMFSRRASRDSTAQTIEADKASRVWEKKSDTYTDALAGILYRIKVRDCQRQRMMTDTESEQPSAPVDWPLVEARLFAYASDDVLKAADAPPLPGIGLQAAQQTGNPPDAVKKAFPHANNMDHTLMDTIRNELQRGPEPAQSAHKPR
jgi:hypothetical protein